jgi:hypothetical protein
VGLTLLDTGAIIGFLAAHDDDGRTRHTGGHGIIESVFDPLRSTRHERSLLHAPLQTV